MDSKDEKDNKNNKGQLKDAKKSDKKQLMVIFLIVAVILLVYFSNPIKSTFLSSTFDSSKEKDESVKNESQTMNDGIESRMEEKLSLISGAGEVKVIISYEMSKELVPVVLSDIQTSVMQDEGQNGASSSKTENQQSEIVTISNNASDSALIVKEKSAVVKGVVVIAKGAHDIKVKMDLLNAVCTLLNISPSQVEVYEMNKE
jgi:stage III sporulation protein AG